MFYIIYYILFVHYIIHHILDIIYYTLNIKYHILYYIYVCSSLLGGIFSNAFEIHSENGEKMFPWILKATVKDPDTTPPSMFASKASEKKCSATPKKSYDPLASFFWSKLARQNCLDWYKLLEIPKKYWPSELEPKWALNLPIVVLGLNNFLDSELTSSEALYRQFFASKLLPPQTFALFLDLF